MASSVNYKVLSVLFILMLMLFAGIFFLKHRRVIILPSEYSKASIVIRDQIINANLARTASEQAKGLSGLEKLGDNNGMLFVFSRPDDYSFWMKDMLFPIDIIWIGDNETVVGVTSELSPRTFPEVFKPPRPVSWALEVNAGWAEKNDVRTGDKVVITYIN